MAKTLSLYDEAQLESLLRLQRKHNWDLEESIPWELGIDLDRPLVMLDRQAFFFPGASAEERLVISQMMGLIIAASIFEMEEALIRLRNESWEEIYRKHPISPEFYDLGHQFFEEEIKHSQSFKRFAALFAQNIGVDFDTLMSVLPIIEKTKTEFVLKNHIARGGQSFWWIVAIVEQHFLLIYRNLAPFKHELDPLYYQIHKLHFEEEARHAPFPYLMLEVLKDYQKGFLGKLFTRYDLMVAQFIQSAWAVSSLARTREAGKLAHLHPFFDILDKVQKRHGHMNIIQVIWKLMTETPYVSPLLNPSGHPQILQYAKERGSLSIPFPDCDPEELVNF